MLTARTRLRPRNAKSLRRRASAMTRRYGKSACLHAKNAHKVQCFTMRTNLPKIIRPTDIQ